METGRNAVNAVFSEYIPLTTLPTTIKYGNNGFKDEARAADEGLAEAASYILGMDISNEFKIPNGKSIVEETTKLLSNQSYKYVPKAIDWMKKNSIDGALDLYMESPKKFLQAIGAEGK